SQVSFRCRLRLHRRGRRTGPAARPNPARRARAACRPQAFPNSSFSGTAIRYDPTMNRSIVTRRLLALGPALAIILDTARQLLWKFCVDGLPPVSDAWHVAEAVLRQPLFLVLAGIFLLQLFNWLKVLEHADLSYAQPITSLSYIAVCVLSAILFGEHIGFAK